MSSQSMFSPWTWRTVFVVFTASIYILLLICESDIAPKIDLIRVVRETDSNALYIIRFIVWLAFIVAATGFIKRLLNLRGVVATAVLLLGVCVSSASILNSRNIDRAWFCLYADDVVPICKDRCELLSKLAMGAPCQGAPNLSGYCFAIDGDDPFCVRRVLYLPVVLQDAKGGARKYADKYLQELSSDLETYDKVFMVSHDGKFLLSEYCFPSHYGSYL